MGTGVLDFVENSIVNALLRSFPSRLQELEVILPYFTSGKYVGFVISVFAIFVGGLYAAGRVLVNGRRKKVE